MSHTILLVKRLYVEEPWGLDYRYSLEKKEDVFHIPILNTRLILLDGEIFFVTRIDQDLSRRMFIVYDITTVHWLDARTNLDVIKERYLEKGWKRERRPLCKNRERQR